ncbi:hypothetical protein [Allosphingosinicella deserti]|uniref:Uncharacterized protein n=1 Tax=Allosphingosinicella deserti TaxID=2116704 RepID=A0A2P7QNC9_9SPHN|nr:hypothetical protein [Sphingomonas deserti]PSJ39473.1 hypothetical protein C7I55_12745 [Sphingomonas deserti]
MTTPPRTPDGRYLIVEGTSGARLWRASNPDLPEQTRQALVDQLMNARRAVRAAAGDAQALVRARAAVDQAKRALGERGPVWWTDGTPDLNRTLVKNSPYRQWWDSRSIEGRDPGT